VARRFLLAQPAAHVSLLAACWRFRPRRDQGARGLDWPPLCGAVRPLQRGAPAHGS